MTCCIIFMIVIIGYIALGTVGEFDTCLIQDEMALMSRHAKARGHKRIELHISSLFLVIINQDLT